MIKPLAIFLTLAMAPGLRSAAPATAPENAKAPSAPTAPVALSPSAPTVDAPDAPAAPAPVSGTASSLSPSAGSDDIVAPEEVGDPMKMAAEAPIADLKPVSSTVLAKLSNALTNASNELYYDAEHGEILKDNAPGAWRVDATALYAELAHRLAYAEDKDARQALNLADLRHDDRAKDARALAFEDKLADATIAQLEAGKPKAKAELERLAGQGNRRARQYLGMDKPLPGTADAPGLTPTASALSPTAGVLSPTAGLSPTAAVTPAADKAPRP